MLAIIATSHRIRFVILLFDHFLIALHVLLDLELVMAELLPNSRRFVPEFSDEISNHIHVIVDYLIINLHARFPGKLVQELFDSA
jgi:hypothetical protein